MKIVVTILLISALGGIGLVSLTMDAPEMWAAFIVQSAALSAYVFYFGD